MWYSAEITFMSYLPDELEVGMLFVNRISVGVIEPYIELWELQELPEDEEAFVSKNGAPVELLIIDYNENILARHEQIGWWDEGDDCDELRDITLEDINFILQEWEGCIAIEVDDDEEIVIHDDKVVLSIDQEDLYEEE